MKNTTVLATRGASLLSLALATAAFGTAADSQCGTRLIHPQTEIKLNHPVHGTTVPKAAPVDVYVRGTLYYTRGRIRVLGELGMQIDTSNPGHDSHAWDTFDRVLFDVAQDAPGCAIRRVVNASTGFEQRLSLTNQNLPPGTNMPLLGDKYGILLPSKCTNWVPGTQAGKVGCTLNFGVMTVELVPVAQLPCTTSSVHLEGSSPTYAFEIPLISQRGDDVISSAEVNVNVTGTLTWSANRVQLENSAVLAEPSGFDSAFSGSKISTLFDVSRDAPGCRITNVSFPNDRFRGFDFTAKNDARYEAFNAVAPQTEPYVGAYAAARCNTIQYKACKVGWNEIDFTVYLGQLTQ